MDSKPIRPLDDYRPPVPTQQVNEWRKSIEQRFNSLPVGSDKWLLLQNMLDDLSTEPDDLQDCASNPASFDAYAQAFADAYYKKFGPDPAKDKPVTRRAA